jgi:recombination protein RecA
VDIIDLLSDSEKSPIPRFSTQFLQLNSLLGGGFPRGITELYGGESTGKTTLALQLGGHFTREGGYTRLWDQEDTFQNDPKSLDRIKGLLGINDFSDYINNLTVANKRSKSNGKKFSSLVVARAETMEEMLHEIESNAAMFRSQKLIPPDQPIYEIDDSLAATETLAEESRGYADKEMASLPASLSRNLKKFTKAAYKYNIVLLCVNQIREKIGVIWGDKDTTPGGRAVKFYAQIRLKMTVVKSLPGGAIVQIQSVKNKVNIPKRRLLMPFTYMGGFSAFDTAMLTLQQFKLAQRIRGGYLLRKNLEEDFTIEIPEFDKLSISKADRVMQFADRIYQENDCFVKFGNKQGGE